MNHIALFEPRIHFNTGNIARTCAATNTVLHLIEPFGFEISDKHLKRAGLDYWDKVNIVYHKNLDDFMNSINDGGQLYLVSKFAEHVYSDVDYSDDEKITTSCLAVKIQVYLKNLCMNIVMNAFVFQ